jgi:diamine N-acetyltransferase
MQTTTQHITVRAGCPNDAELLARIGAATFYEAFAADNSPENMAAYLASAFSPDIQAAELQSPDTVFLIASSGGEPAGYAKLQMSDAPGYVGGERPIELARFYVEAAWHGRGVSHALMRETIERALGDGHDVLWLGVWDRNGRAVAFYRKWGFEVVGSKPFLLGSDLQTDYVMKRHL